MIKIDFEMEHPIYGVYRDAIYLSENNSLTQEDIENIKKARFDSWINTIENPAPDTDAIEINGERYELLREVPPAGAVLFEQDGNWYFKV